MFVFALVVQFFDHNRKLGCEVVRKSQRLEKEETPTPAPAAEPDHAAPERSSSSKPQSAMNQARWNFAAWNFQKNICEDQFSFCLLLSFCVVCPRKFICHAVTKNTQVRAYTLKHNGKIEWAHRAWMKSKERAAFLAARKGEQL